jgi:glutamyl-tRNA synthetase
VTLNDINDLTAYFFDSISLDAETLQQRATGKEQVMEQLNQTIAVLTDTAWHVETLETALRQLQHDHDWQPKQYFMMLRMALTGQTATPPLFDTMQVLGKTTVLSRLHEAIHKLN